MPLKHSKTKLKKLDSLEATLQKRLREQKPLLNRKLRLDRLYQQAHMAGSWARMMTLDRKLCDIHRPLAKVNALVAAAQKAYDAERRKLIV